MNIPALQLKNLLVSLNAITPERFEEATTKAIAADVPIEVYLAENGYVPDAQMGKIIADYLGFPFLDLTKEKIEKPNLSILPENSAKTSLSVIFKQDDKNLYVATHNPENYPFFKALERKVQKSVLIYYSTFNGVNNSLIYYKTELASRMAKLVDSIKVIGRKEEVIELVDTLLEYAFDNRASDIHIEPLQDLVSVRFRIDGILHEVATYPIDIHEKVSSRIKVIARLRTDEREIAQDGRFSFKAGDVRVSFLPITNGENIVLRILLSGAQRYSLNDLGLSERDLEKVRVASKKPFGMILTVGPTGSGKTTSTYAVLNVLNRPEVNIMTIEDPVEYEIEHVQQTQVNHPKNLTFSTGLRSIIRQDPNVVMVGEIRDNETAEIAVNAAMTGHLLLSTLHANDAATVFPRLFGMNIEPFLIASSVNIVIAQRLVRKICTHCSESALLTPTELALIESKPLLAQYLKEATNTQDLTSIKLYRGKGCKDCNIIGYAGRSAIFEVMEITDELRDLITQRASADVIGKKAVEQGMYSMLKDGAMKMSKGMTTLEELIRVTNI